MQLFPASATQGSQSVSDGSGADARTTTDPSSGDAFRTALSSARQNTNRASAADRKTGRAGGPTTGEPGDAAESDAAIDARDVTPAMLEADALAALLPILTPTPPTPPVPAPVDPTSNGGNGTALDSVTAGGTGTPDYKAMPTAYVPQQASAPAAPATAAAATTATSAPVGTAPTGPTPAGPQATVPQSAAAAMMRLLRPTPNGEATPASAPASTASTTPEPTTLPTPTVAATAPPPISTVPPPAAPAAPVLAAMPSITAAAGGTQQQAPTAVPATTTQGLFSTAQAQFGSGAVSITTTSVVPATVQTQASGQPLTFAESSLWADLAAEFEARIIAATSPLAARLTGNSTATTTGLPLAPAEDAANLIAAGSTAEAAGAGAPAPAMVQMPGIAVAGAGAAAASSGTATFAEALAASALTETAARTTQSTESTAEPNSAAIHAAATHHLGQAQAAADAQPAGTSAVPVASQIADAALTAARRPGQSVEMVLQPEGLGTVSLKVTVERGGLSVHLSVDNAGTRDIVQASWPQLQAAFEQRGLSVQALLLDLSGGRGGSEAFQSFQQFTGQQPGQQFGGQQAAGQQRNGSAGTDRSGTAAIGAIDEGPRPQAGVGASARVDYRI